MARWHLVAAGECDDPATASQEIADLLDGHGVAVSQWTTDEHNGPLPKPSAKPKRSGKGAEAT